MEVTKGMIGRRVCGGIQVFFGVLLLFSAIYDAVVGHLSIMSFLFAAFIIMTGVFGLLGTTNGRIIAYLLCGVVCCLVFLFSIIFNILALVGYFDQSYDDSSLLAGLIIALVISIFAFTVSLIGVICSILPWCGQ